MNDAVGRALGASVQLRDERLVRWFWLALLLVGLFGVADTIALSVAYRMTTSILLPGVAGCGLLFLVACKWTLRRGRPFFPGRLNLIFWSLAGAGAVLFAGVEAALVVAGMQARPAENPDCMIVLGAGLWGWEPSPTLQRRLETAARYLQEHPAMQVVVSGGQGPGEDRTEAGAMQEYLIARGIAPERIVCEAESRTTWENFQNTWHLLEQSPVRIGRPHGKTIPELLVVTSGFHMLRAQILAGRVGFTTSGLSAPTPAVMRINQYGREFCALLKSLLLDRY